MTIDRLLARLETVIASIKALVRDDDPVLTLRVITIERDVAALAEARHRQVLAHAVR